MRYLFRLGSAAVAVLLAGCANHPFNAINSTSYPDATKDGQETYSRVFAWDSTYSAGVGNSKGLCVQGALTAKSSAFSAALEGAVEKIDTHGNGAVNFAEAVMALNASSVQTAYANAGYFYLCQLALNQSTAGNPLPTSQLAAMWANVGETAQNLKMPAAPLTSLSAPQLNDIRTYLRSLNVQDVPESDAELQRAIDEAVKEQTAGSSN